MAESHRPEKLCFKSLITSRSSPVMKKSRWNLFKSKHRAQIPVPVSFVRQTRELLQYFNSSVSNLDRGDRKREEKMAQLCKLLREIKLILYGSTESEPVPEACAQLTEEFFKDNTFRLLVLFLPNLNLEARKDATQVVANLQRQQVKCCLVACSYLVADIDLMDILVKGYEDPSMALHYGSMLRECIRHQTVAKYVLENHMRKMFGYILLPNFEISSDASASFKELLTRHKSTVHDFLSENYDWFFKEYNTKLLQSPVYITRRQAVKLLGDILLAPTNASTMEHYVSSKENLMIFMDLLKVSHALRSGTEQTELEICVLEDQEPSKVIQLDAFQVFKLFVANKHKPPEIAAILIANHDKLQRLLACFSMFKENNSQFEEDRVMVGREIAALELSQEIRGKKEFVTE